LRLQVLGQKPGTCFQRCVRLDGINAVYSVAYEIDQKQRKPLMQGELKYGGF
jgi:4-hydroxybutyryl-CoA dehydratase/vinylacetyl-CoA-Delta-isomerase